MAFDPFYPILDSAAWIARLLPHGIRIVQLRIKSGAREIIHSEISRAKALCDAAGVVLIVNDFWRDAIDLKCDWVHLGQEDLDHADVPAIRRAGLKIGLSTHDEAELDRALEFAPDYIALGPIYPTRLKAMRFAPQGLDKLTRWKARVGDLPLIGIGGVTLERAPGVLAAGADGAAVVTDITLHADPESRTQAWSKMVGPKSST